uniref:RRM domain-containing protein n=1 Tax=Alexandrium monilatum TaxID=311494 RepID=A0A7S4R7G9_9DINO|mmetsp:Transcript_37715/g.117278  ORF Transcript_37715/g.117278 Transcript_37715/m.117278 type:complete len:399 (+) Transcript_37715:28-1224(+)
MSPHLAGGSSSSSGSRHGAHASSVPLRRGLPLPPACPPSGAFAGGPAPCGWGCQCRGRSAAKALLSVAALTWLSAGGGQPPVAPSSVVSPGARGLGGARACGGTASSAAPAFAVARAKVPCRPRSAKGRRREPLVQRPQPPPGADASTPMVKRDLKVPLFYQVSFAEEQDARRAPEELDGSVLGGSTLRVVYNTRGWRKTFVNVQGVPRGISEEELRDHFALVGKPNKVVRFEDTLYGEVRFKKADDAWNARVTLDGSVLFNKVLRVELDCSTDFMNKVLVHGINPGVAWQELKDHFKQAGEITFAAIHGGPTARVLFQTRDAAVRAMKRRNRSKLRGTTNAIHVALPFEGTEDSAEVRVRGLPLGVTAEAIEKHFAECGSIASVRIEVEPLPPEFCE